MMVNEDINVAWTIMDIKKITMKKLLGIVVLGYRIMWDNSNHTRTKRDKAEFRLV